MPETVKASKAACTLQKKRGQTFIHCWCSPLCCSWDLNKTAKPPVDVKKSLLYQWNMNCYIRLETKYKVTVGEKIVNLQVEVEKYKKNNTASSNN